MPTTPPALIEIASRHQVYLEGYKTTVSNKVDTFLVEMSRIIEKRLSGDITDFTRTRLEKLIQSVSNDLRDQYFKYYEVWSGDIVDFSVYESGFEIRSLRQVVKKEFNLPSKTQLKSAVFSAPLSSLQGADKAVLLESFYRGWTEKTVKSVEGIIRAGFYQGRTTPQIVRDIKGTKSLKFRDGQLASGKKDITLLTRTAVQHAAVRAREETWGENDDIISGVTWISTLDGRTSDICLSLDQEFFPLNEGPRPPAHPGCRSSVVAALDSRFSILGSTRTRSSRNEKGMVEHNVPAKEQVYKWLKNRDPDFTDSVIGPVRGKLLREGGLSAQRFADLNLDKEIYKPRTLKEMAALEPLAFKNAGLEKYIE